MESNAEMEIFHPIHRRGAGAWFPGNDDTSLLVHIGHSWEDIERLVKMRSECADEYDRKLLLKYLFIEVRSLMQAMDRLQGLVMKCEAYPDGECPPYRGISCSEKERATALWADYSQAKARVERDIIQIRNKIGAHRRTSDWQLVMQLWDKLNPNLLEGLLQAIPLVYNFSKDLNIFEWNRRHEDGVIEILAGPVDPTMFDRDKSG